MSKNKETVDMDRCVAAFDDNQFNLILAASVRAREISNTRNIAIRDNPTLRYEHLSVVTALTEISDGKIGKEYLKKVK